MAYRKGYDLERDIAKLAGKFGRRVQKSGAIGTTEHIDKLVGDVQWNFPFLSKSIVFECKHGYQGTGTKQVIVKKEWFDKLIEQSKNAIGYKFIPAWAFKFKFTNDTLICFNAKHFESIIQELVNLWEENQQLKEKLNE